MDVINRFGVLCRVSQKVGEKMIREDKATLVEKTPKVVEKKVAEKAPKVEAKEQPKTEEKPKSK